MGSLDFAVEAFLCLPTLQHYRFSKVYLYSL